MSLFNSTSKLRLVLGTRARGAQLIVTAGLVVAAAFAALPAIAIVAASVDAIAQGHFTALLGAALDPRNLLALSNSLFVATTVSISVTSLAVLLALLLYLSRATGDPIIYALAMVPLLVPDYLFGVVGRALVEPQFGLLAWLVPDDLLSSRMNALGAIILITLLKWLPPLTVATDAQIASMSPELLDQAAVDFSSKLGLVRFVFVPRMFRVVPFLALLTFLLAFREQELASELTSKGGGFRAEMWADWNYRTIYEFFDFTSAAASALLVLALLLVLVDAFRRSIMSGDRSNM